MNKMNIFGAVVALLALILSGDAPARGESQLGPVGAEGAPNRRQEWLVPTPDQITVARALLFRPPGKGPFPLAIIAHASTQNRLQRAQMPQPDYPALSELLVARGYAVLVPQRSGHGKTGGPYLEDQDGCDNAQYGLAARATGDAIASALAFMRTQGFVRKDGALIVGHSAGGWGALALADENPKSISRIVVFAAGRGGHKDGRADSICAPEKLIAAAKELGEHAQVPVTWIVAENDSYFPPDDTRQMTGVFSEGGDKVDLRVVPPFGNEGHWLAEAGDAATLAPLLPDDLNAAPARSATRK